jgi:putative sterol carrier protein
MTDPTTEFFDGLARRSHEPLLEKVKATLRFEIVRGKSRKRWLVSIDDGDVTVSRRNAAADAVVRADQALFDRLVTGQENAMAAVLRGAMLVEGDLDALILFQRLFPSPPIGQEKP